MKDPEEFVRELERVPVGAEVTEADLDADAESFMAFAAAMGVKPPAADGTA